VGFPQAAEVKRADFQHAIAETRLLDDLSAGGLMTVTFILLLASWGVLGVIVLVLAAYKTKLGRQEDDHIHFSEREAALVASQAQVAHRLELVEKWGKTLTVVLVLYGIALGAYYLYTLFQLQSTRAIVD
jgi:hypothetical protein